MPIIKQKEKIEKEQLRISIEKPIIETVRQYCEWAGVKTDDFFEQASKFLLSKDKDWHSYVSQKSSS